jgi:hypothetical protein
MFTVNPGAQAPGTTGMIVAGRALQLYVEYNSLGQFRFDVIPSAVNVISSTGALTAPSLSSAWYPVNTEHTVGVSYNAAGYITMVVDGDFASATTLADLTLMQPGTNTGNNGLAIGGANGFNGFIGQVVDFRGPLSPTELAAVTQDPAGVANSLGGTITPATTGHIETALATRGAGADNVKESVSSKAVISEAEIKYKKLLSESAQLKTENEEFRKALKKFRNMLVETVVFNSNLSYVTKLFMEHSTTKDEKKKIIQRFDEEVTNLKESKKLYKSIVNELSVRKPMTESVENKIMKEVATSSSKQLNEATAYVDPSTKRIKDLISRVENKDKY